MHKLSTWLVAGAASLAAAAAPVAAEAAPYAFASNQISNLTIGFASGDPFGPAVRPGSAITTVAANANYDGVGTSLSSNGVVGSALNLGGPGFAFAGPGPAGGNNVFTPLGAGAFVGARGDAAIGAGVGPTGAVTVSNVAEGYLASVAPGTSADSGARNTATISFGIAISTSQSLVLNFSNLIELIASTAGAAGESATASVSNTFVVSRTDGTVVFSAAPTEINRQVGSSVGIPPILSIGPVSYDITLNTGLLAAGSYNVTLTSVATETVTIGTPVPEPASLALFGIALLGLGAAARRGMGATDEG